MQVLVPPEHTILVVDDEKNIRRMLRLVLEGEGYRVREAGDAPEMFVELHKAVPDLVILDVRLPGQDGIAALEQLRGKHTDLAVIMVSGHASIGDAVRATRAGAMDFFEKPLDRDRVLLAVRNALTRHVLEERNEALASRAFNPGDDPMLGNSTAMKTLRESIAKVAPTPGRVLITGESGTGKELVARAIHVASKRSRQPFVKVNCAAIPQTLIESELFGHERGSFSGAERRKRGLFELADGGTLFLDEVGDMAEGAQAKVLRVLQSGEMNRVGGESTLTVDVRVVAATNRNLEEAVKKGAFREDLYFRLAVVPLNVPPLRARADDIPVLVRSFMDRFCRDNGLPHKEVSPDALKSMTEYRWPGNIRELRNVCERLSILGGDPISPADLPREMAGGAAGPPDELSLPPALARAEGMSLRDFRDEAERWLVEKRLRECDWNITRAAQALGLERTNLHKKIRQLGLARPGDLPADAMEADAPDSEG
ncbi:MAG: sigma-54-dependent Fis family transcriptional regulator [Deltaproteobacteria bacterium]|nr:sigma-54-dependent Fis family transcriptional regulator [Deltaproteobacteria bacterium]